MELKPEHINTGNVTAFGNAGITRQEQGLLVEAKKGGGVWTGRFRSLAESVHLKLCGEIKGGGAVNYAVYAYDGQEREQVVYEQSVCPAGEKSFAVSYRFDPICLAVYQHAVSFRVAVFAESEQAEFSLDRLSLEEEVSNNSSTQEGTDEDRGGSLVESAGSVVTLENGEKGVVVFSGNGERRIVPLVPKKVLFVGNSLLLGMFQSYGMCSSAPDKDYASYVQWEICKYNPHCVFTKLMGSGFEMAESLEAFEAWFWREPVCNTKRPAKDSFTGDLDLILIQLTDNVNTDQRIAAFEKTADLLMERIRERSPNARIIWIHGWYNKYNTCDTLAALCRRWGLERIDISDLHRKENEAAIGQLCENENGNRVPAEDAWITHPGDAGMQKIAARIIQRLGISRQEKGINYDTDYAM